MKRLSITWVVFIAYLSLLVGGVHETVLCLGENGHIAVEAAQNGGCSSFLPGFYLTPSPSHSPVFSSPANPHCGPCIDFDVTTIYACRINASAQKKLSPLQQKNSFSDTAQILFPETPQEFVLPLTQFSEYRPSPLLQTTVLLI